MNTTALKHVSLVAALISSSVATLACSEAPYVDTCASSATSNGCASSATYLNGASSQVPSVPTAPTNLTTSSAPPASETAVSTATQVSETMEPTPSVSTTTEPTLTESPSTVLSLSSPGLEFAADCAVGTPESCSVFRPENTSYMGNGNVSPELTWSNVPSGTASFAIKFTDLTFGQAHWAIWNIPAGSTSLPAGIAGDTSNPAVPAGAIQTNATFAEGFGYLGPQAPCNVYEFVLYALAVERFEPSKPDFVTLVGDELEAAEAPVLGRATLAARNYVAGECD